jgi:hypothetical protein
MPVIRRIHDYFFGGQRNRHRLSPCRLEYISFNFITDRIRLDGCKSMAHLMTIKKELPINEGMRSHALIVKPWFQETERWSQQ